MAVGRDVVGSVGHDVFELRVPASADSLSIARRFATAMIRPDGAGEDAVEDLRLAVSEACTLALQAGGPRSAMLLSLRPVREGVAVRVATTDVRATADETTLSRSADEPRAVSELANGWGAELLEAIVSDLELTSGADGGIGVSFVFRFVRGTEAEHDQNADHPDRQSG